MEDTEGGHKHWAILETLQTEPHVARTYHSNCISLATVASAVHRCVSPLNPHYPHITPIYTLYNPQSLYNPYIIPVVSMFFSIIPIFILHRMGTLNGVGKNDPQGLLCRSIWGFPKIRGTFWGVPIIRIILYWGLFWGPLILGNYHFVFATASCRGLYWYMPPRKEVE